MVWLGAALVYLLVYLGRAVLGVLLAALLSVIGIGIAWGMFVFWEAVSHATLLSLFMTGAGVGTGIGSLAAWLKIDLAPPTSVLVVVALLLMLTGIGRLGWFPIRRQSRRPLLHRSRHCPNTYTVLGATIVANVVALGMGLIHGIGRHRDWPGFRAEGPSSAAGASGESGPPKVPYELFSGKGLMLSGGLR